VKAAWLRDFDSPLEAVEIPDPRLRPGAVIVRVLAAFVPGAMIEFTRGRVPFALPTPPYVPGTDAIGMVEAIADDVHGLRVGEAVYCDDRVSVPGQPEVGAYVGLTGTVPGAEAVLAQWPNGAFAERFMLPADCFTPLGEAATIAPALLARLGYFGTAYHAIRRGAFAPGQVVVVNGATGILGVSAVLLLLAMGAARIVAMGRRASALERLRALDRRRVVAVRVDGDAIDAHALIDAAGERAHLFVDAIGFTRSAAATLAGIGALAHGGHAVLVGGVNVDVPIAYATQMIGLELTIRGSEWFPRAAAAELLRMVGAGVLDLSCLEVRAFPLEQAQAAVAAAADGSGGFAQVVIVPDAA
jgi:alcohol dehydrogenase